MGPKLILRDYDINVHLFIQLLSVFVELKRVGCKHGYVVSKAGPGEHE